MAEHEPSIGATSEWFTPPEYFEGPEPRPLTAKTGVRPLLGSANDSKALVKISWGKARCCTANVRHRRCRFFWFAGAGRAD